ncbi:NAD(P)H-dependent glycerol-3-phosphate dehydrogenase [Paenibacillus sp. J2TS4]|uniref:NAD(P)H-dependent glycerol-3-phosphate dehydrogenase n=1 Tax=Paenibacillus sp. J2TS4 TaxID=2807194 RepID=UPI001B043330|nr:NAD(P)H-dependent glycerol-3-phosphate dehydrogenase [Paenibacillus sp. J2TS4]GIP32376.1 glycerol-3-phosphate dehydrogenase [NAD(P)+] [Paenibacillus sp. J2TS4]
MAKTKATVVVAGSWGTALATVLAANHHEVTLWTRSDAQAEEINRTHRNSRFLKEAVLPDTIKATTSIEEAIIDSEAVILVAPSHGMREVVGKIRPFLRPQTLLVHATKGFETDSLKRMTTVISEELPDYDRERIAVLSGPSHAEEVVQQSPTTVVVAASRLETAEEAQDLLNNTYFRVYTNPDVSGVEIGGALKNIIALGAGMSDGLGFGDNAKAALMTRGLAEMARLGTAMDGNPLTFAGLAGVGDLIVTCTSRHSRNWRAGHMLGQGAVLDEVLESMGMVVEGVKTTKAAYALADRYKVEMPITRALYDVLFNGKKAKDAVGDLMGRVPTHEMEEIAQTGSLRWK